MEFEILNEIMTGTVATLFREPTRHANFMKTSSQMGQDKSEIPKSQSSSDLFAEIGKPSNMEDTPLNNWL